MDSKKKANGQQDGVKAFKPLFAVVKVYFDKFPVTRLVPFKDQPEARKSMNRRSMRQSLEAYGILDPLAGVPHEWNVRNGNSIKVRRSLRHNEMVAISDGIGRWEWAIKHNVSTVPLEVYFGITAADLAMHLNSSAKRWSSRQLGQVTAKNPKALAQIQDKVTKNYLEKARGLVDNDTWLGNFYSKYGPNHIIVAGEYATYIERPGDHDLIRKVASWSARKRITRRLRIHMYTLKTLPDELESYRLANQEVPKVKQTTEI